MYLTMTLSYTAFATSTCCRLGLSCLPCDALAVTLKYGMPIDARGPMHALICHTLPVLRVLHRAQLVNDLCCAIQHCGVATIHEPHMASLRNRPLEPARALTTGASFHACHAARSTCPEGWPWRHSLHPGHLHVHAGHLCHSISAPRLHTAWSRASCTKRAAYVHYGNACILFVPASMESLGRLWRLGSPALQFITNLGTR
jgi:hypothetical protein